VFIDFDQAAAVACRVPGQECSSSEFKCDSGECLLLKYLCDEFDDCQDMSDSFPERCQV